MRILILGTSNSILRQGWVSGLREALPEDEIVNLSVGASPGTQFGRHLAMDFSHYDLVFFDSIVNEENFGALLGPQEFTTQLIYQIVSSIAAQTRVILLGFSNKRYFTEDSHHYRKRQEIAASCGCQFIGMLDLARAHGSRLSTPGQGFFTDHGSHIRYDLQKHFGFLIGQTLQTHWTALPAKAPVTNFSSCFVLEDITKNLPGGQKVQKSNSLMAIDFAKLDGGAAWNFHSPGLCLGFYLAADATKCVIAMHGGGRTRWKELWYSQDSARFQLKFVPIAGGFPLQTLQAMGSAIKPPNAAVIERSIHSTLPRAGQPDFTDNQLTLMGTLFWLPNAIHLPPPSEAEMAQSRLLERQISQSIAAALAA